MKLFKRIIGVVGAIALWVWAALPKALDWVGRTTVPDDWEQLMEEKLPALLGWLFATPWWVPATLATILTIWLILPSRTERDAEIESDQSKAISDEASIIEAVLNPAPPPKSNAATYDAPNKLKAIDEVLDIFGFDMTLHNSIRRGRALRGPWEQEILEGRLDQYFEAVKGYRDEFWHIVLEIKKIHDKNERYPDVQTILSRGDLLSKGQGSRFFYSMSVFIDNMKRLGPNPTPNHLQLYKPYADDFRLAFVELEAWRDQISKELLTIRGELVG